jgi:hypothetical protein
MDDEEMYDEFGNYLGPEIGAHSDDSESSEEREER